MLADAILLSAWKNQTITLPFDDDEYFNELEKRIANLKTKKTADIIFDLSNTYIK